MREGWRQYESRWAVKSLKLLRRYADRPQWQGSESVKGRVVLVHHEQGYGDSIQFSRYCAQLADRGASVVLSAPSPLHTLFKNLPGVREVVAQGVDATFDFHCPLMSLPLALGTELATIPAPLRYLQAEAGAKQRWARRLKAKKTKPVIGLAWAGRATHAKDGERSIAVTQCLPLLTDRCQWVSLQKELRTADERSLAGAPVIQRLGEELTDFADAAALIENLDLVISVDTAVAHLAGALGKPVWIILPWVADWRWLQDREDSPWYPTARLFRQTEPGDWAPVIERVAAEIQRLVELKPRNAAARSGARPRKQ
jgi:hypothetical protein